MANKKEENSLVKTGWMAVAFRSNGTVFAQTGWLSYDQAVKWGNAMKQATQTGFVLLFEGLQF